MNIIVFRHIHILSKLRNHPFPTLKKKKKQVAEADAAVASLREKLHASAVEAESFAAELQETKQAMAARDELLTGAREVNAETKERLSSVRAQAEEEARRAAAAETLAASEGGKQHV